jgi:3-oxoacyl-[acyl-carrier protein] reductase
MDISLHGKRAIVTGGSRGIGRSIAITFAENGADVAVCSRGVEALKVVDAELQSHGAKVFAASCDVGDASALGSFISGAADALGGIDILINNASGLGLADDESGWQAGINVDLLATVRACRAAVPHMEKAGGGSIINIASIAGVTGLARGLPYAAVKAAIVNYTKGQALALAAKNIRVNAIAPGSIEFPGGIWDQRRTAHPGLYRETVAKIPSGRFGKPEEIATVALFLASALASWITGQTVVVDGGQSL